MNNQERPTKASLSLRLLRNILDQTLAIQPHHMAADASPCLLLCRNTVCDEGSLYLSLSSASRKAKAIPVSRSSAYMALVCSPMLMEGAPF
jgi:hypothetical protein